MRITFALTAMVLGLSLGAAAPARAADSGAAELKSEIDGLLDKLDASTHGLIKWEGADSVTIREEGKTAIAEMTNARLSLGAEDKKPGSARARVSFDHFEVRRTPAADATELSFVFPKEGVVNSQDHGDVRLSLKEAKAQIVIDGQSHRARSSELSIAATRIEDKPSGSWISLGPLALSSKIVAASGGGWTGPIDFTLKEVEFFLPEAPVGGRIERIAYNAQSAGPDLAALNRLRDRLDALRQQDDLPPGKRADAMLDLVPALLPLFSEAKGEMTLDGLTVRPPNGEILVGLAKASMKGALTGLSGDMAALRITIQHDGLALAPPLLEPGKVPRRAVLDIGLEEMATAPLRSMLEAVGRMRTTAGNADKQQAEQQIIGAAAMLNPVLRVYDLAIDTPDAGVYAVAEARGSPLSPKGFSAQGDVSVRGFDALAAVVGDAPPAAYLPVLKEIGSPAKAEDGSPRLKFHLVATLQKWLTVNGSDVTAWLADDGATSGQPRSLRPAEPALSGADVVAVQRALAAAKIGTPQNGKYDGATAAAVARFQKANGLNVDGVVNAATRQKLGVKPEPPQSPGGKKGAN